MSHPSTNPGTVQGTETAFHPRIAELIKTCRRLNIRCIPWDRNAVVVGRFPNHVDVTIERVEVSEYQFYLETYRCKVLRTKEVFHVVAIGPGYLFRKLVEKGIPVNEN